MVVSIFQSGRIRENHLKLINVQNRFGKAVMKPEEVEKFNDYMSGIDRCDQMVN